MEDVYINWIDEDSHFDVAEVSIKEEICNAFMSPQKIERVNTDNEKKTMSHTHQEKNCKCSQYTQ